MRALVLREVPDADVAAAVAGDELALVRVDDDVVDGGAVGVVALDVAGAGVPDFDCAWEERVSVEVVEVSEAGAGGVPSSELVTWKQKVRMSARISRLGIFQYGLLTIHLPSQ